MKHKEGSSSGLMVKDRAPDSPDEPDDNSMAIQACAQDLIKAVHNRDVKATAEALQSAFDILESLPHEESGLSPHSYDAQNQAAGEE